MFLKFIHFSKFRFVPNAEISHSFSLLQYFELSLRMAKKFMPRGYVPCP